MQWTLTLSAKLELLVICTLCSLPFSNQSSFCQRRSKIYKHWTGSQHVWWSHSIYITNILVIGSLPKQPNKVFGLRGQTKGERDEGETAEARGIWAEWQRHKPQIFSTVNRALASRFSFRSLRSRKRSTIFPLTGFSFDSLTDCTYSSFRSAAARSGLPLGHFGKTPEITSYSCVQQFLIHNSAKLKKK